MYVVMGPPVSQKQHACMQSKSAITRNLVICNLSIDLSILLTDQMNDPDSRSASARYESYILLRSSTA